MGTGGTALAAGVLLILITGSILFFRIPAEEREVRWGVIRAGLALRRARAAHEGLVRSAERAVRRTERQHSANLADLDQRILRLEDPRGVRLDALGPVTLHALRIITPAGEAPLDGAQATVDRAGALTERKRTTFTRLAVGAATFGAVGAIVALGFPKRKQVDNRELYLLIEAGAASCVLQIDPNDGARVRAFATQINAAAGLVAERRAATARELAAARAELEAVREDHSAMDAARERVLEAREDPSALRRTHAAERALAEMQRRLRDLRQQDEAS